METKGEFLQAISKRGDYYGNCDGILDLLVWCGKYNTRTVTLEEARSFYENPRQPYCFAYFNKHQEI